MNPWNATSFAKFYMTGYIKQIPSAGVNLIFEQHRLQTPGAARLRGKKNGKIPIFPLQDVL